MDNDELDDFITTLSSLTNTALKETALSDFDLRRLLRFLSKVVQVAEYAFQDVLVIMIELKYISEVDKKSGKLDQLHKELELLHVHSRLRDAQEISIRLHLLVNYYDSELEPITANLSNDEEWKRIWPLIDEREGRMVMLVERSLWELKHLLREADISKINASATQHLDNIRYSLSQLRSLNSQILGLSGRTGFLELTEDKMPRKTNGLEVKIGDTYNISGQAGVVGPNVHAHTINFGLVGNQIAGAIDLEELSKELAQLRKAMKSESITVEHDIAIGEIAKAEQAAKSKDSSKLAEHLKAAGKWALDIATKISASIAVEAIKQAIGMK